VLSRLIYNLAVFNPFPPVDTDSALKNISNIVFVIVGGLAVLFVALGGFRFVISRGDPGGIAKARNTIIYASIGVIVTLLAAAIVNFVILRV